MNNSQAADDLQTIVDTCKDSLMWFKLASEQTSNEKLKSLFLSLMQQRKDFIEEIKNDAILIGIKINENGTTSSFLHRYWLTLKTAFSNNTNKEIIEKSVVNENGVIKVYSRVFIKWNVPEFLIPKLKEQQNQVQVAIAKLRNIAREQSGKAAV